MCNVYDGREKQDDKASCVFGSPTTLQSFIVGTSNLFSLFLSHFCLHYTFQRNTTSSIFFVHTYFFSLPILGTQAWFHNYILLVPFIFQSLHTSTAFTDSSVHCTIFNQQLLFILLYIYSWSSMCRLVYARNIPLSTHIYRNSPFLSSAFLFSSSHFLLFPQHKYIFTPSLLYTPISAWLYLIFLFNLQEHMHTYFSSWILKSP